MKKLLIIICLGLLLAACGSKSSIEIKYDGQQIPFEQKNGWIIVQKAIFGYGEAEKKEHALRWIRLRNYDVDVTKGGPDNSTIQPSAPEQIEIFISLHDAADTSVETPLKTAEYKGFNTSVAPMAFEIANVFIFKDGKKEMLSLSPAQDKNPGNSVVKITSVKDDEISGEINAASKYKDKDFSIKGTFTAKIYKR